MHTSVRHRAGRLGAINLSSFHTRIPPTSSGGCSCLAGGVSELPGETALPDLGHTSRITVGGTGTYILSLFLCFSPAPSPPLHSVISSLPFSWVGWEDAGLPHGGGDPLEFTVGWGGAGQDREVLFSLPGDRVACKGGRNGLGHPVRCRWWGLTHRGTLTPSLHNELHSL